MEPADLRQKPDEQMSADPGRHSPTRENLQESSLPKMEAPALLWRKEKKKKRKIKSLVAVEVVRETFSVPPHH